jgi:hypothetical protein
VFGVVILVLNVALAFAFGEFGFTWDQIVYYVAIVPAALLGSVMGSILPARSGGWRELKATVDALFRLLDDPSPGVRKNALDALEVIAPREVLELALAKMQNDADEHNRDTAKQMQEELRKREK